MSIEERTELSKAREALAASVFSALDRLKQYFNACGTESLSYETIAAASLELAGAASEMDLRLRAVTRLQYPNADRVGCCSYEPDRQSYNWPDGRKILNHFWNARPATKSTRPDALMSDSSRWHKIFSGRCCCPTERLQISKLLLNERGG